MGKKILLADDSITIQKVIELTFSDEDFEVATVGNGRLAVEKLEEVRPDIVLCDIIMPEKDGYEVCDYIKKHPSFGHVPVLLLTGAFEPFDQERAARVGCDGFLAKPFEPQSLIAKVKDLLAQAASRPAPRPAAPAPPPAAAVPEPPPATPAPLSYVAPPPPRFEPEPPVMFVPDEPIVEEAPPGTFDAPMELTPEPGVPPPPYAEAPIEQEMYPVEETMEAAPEEFMPLGASEAALPEAPAVGAVPAPAIQEPEEDDGSSTVVFRPADAQLWAQPTLEVPLETRAQAGRQAAREAATAPAPPVFDEMVEEPAPQPVAPAFAAPPPPPELEQEPTETFEPAFEPASFEPDFGEPTPPAPSAFVPPPPPPFVPPPPAEPPRVVAAPPPPPPAASAGAPADASFEEVAPVATPPLAAATAFASTAAEVSVPVEQVAQIAQRVVAQISEKVVREIAWEIIPDLAEALIKKEIERLKAELERS
jgi:CheY-like chemotaxis protein